MVYRVVIGGCRYFNDYSVFKSYVDFYLSNIKTKGELIILSGHCSGTDLMAERYAYENGYLLEIYPAQWEIYGRFAGPKRNRFMVEKTDFVIAFWDNKSRGTKNLIDISRKLSKPIRIKYI